MLGHEVGHTLGLGHPNEQRNFECDSDPVDIEVVALRPR
jgi:predicted Zn-dependent protease